MASPRPGPPLVGLHRPNDNFMSECQQAIVRGGSRQGLHLHVGKVTGAVRADANAAMHSMNTTEAVIAAHGQCQ